MANQSKLLKCWKIYCELVLLTSNLLGIFQSSIQITHYDVLYGRWCRTPLCLLELCENKEIG
ncbi:Retrotransposable element Tf2 [Gossypium australe]|uniref:Retrotransposable element Tf2 n=1 Tax=Gossypium australe TaxID=47621 RepID=A0A5B6V8D7_9ROSI|nr:Retrotransposable element Tf2 [Gossypium australe]